MHENSYYKQLLEQNKQIQEPAYIEKCNELSKQLLYTRLASSLPFHSLFFSKHVSKGHALASRHSRALQIFLERSRVRKELNEEQSESEIETTAMSLAEDSLS